MELGRVAEYVPRDVPDEDHDAAVLAPVVEREGDHYLLFTKRADHLGEHAGQMSFPGGGREPSDADLRATALREAEEEIGLRPAEADIVGRLDDIRTTSRYAVTPYVATVPDREYTPDEREVAEIAVLPVAGLVDPDNHEVERREHPQYGESIVHFFHVGGYTVWGATARILVQLLELTTDWRAPEDVDKVVDPDADVRQGK
ncbi:CoA pyrophosphatase [Halorussus sp. MSC15.2]|uniref:NUDIX hydrolase n=1 Tax=Halorussus sp. MSC15.2 TaxID=2283638 RepID=UPI0013D0F979|nr:CoA pyrophosphatase [Halorussus sp. MSC15.2]NEU57469.1 CoA pyrophosphatase [Halorussus sp. MSC15.2]